MNATANNALADALRHVKARKRRNGRFIAQRIARYREWCRAHGLDPRLDASGEAYDDRHFYQEAWD